MAFFEDVVVTESLPIKTTREKLFTYLTGIVDDESFKTLNAKNVSFRWLKGRPWTAGSVAYAEKYLHGKLHKFEFIIETEGDRCRFISSATFRVGWVGKAFFKKSIEKGLSVFRMYLREESENLKRILESEYT